MGVPTLTCTAPDDTSPHKTNPLMTVPLDRVCVVGNLWRSLAQTRSLHDLLWVGGTKWRTSNRNAPCTLSTNMLISCDPS